MAPRLRFCKLFAGYVSRSTSVSLKNNRAMLAYGVKVGPVQRQEGPLKPDLTFSLFPLSITPRPRRKQSKQENNNCR